jgi:hypothetical protein
MSESRTVSTVILSPANVSLITVAAPDHPLLQAERTTNQPSVTPLTSCSMSDRVHESGGEGLVESCGHSVFDRRLGPPVECPLGPAAVT